MQPLPCPCGSGLLLAACCGPRHDGASPPETAEALMRSRYSAFVLGLGEYLVATQAPQLSHEPADRLNAWSRSVDWLGLRVLRTERGQQADARGMVEFEARYVDAGRSVVMHELSRFDRPGGRWRYVGGRRR